MKKLLFVSIAALLMPLSLAAQTSTAGLKGGLNLSGLTVDGNVDRHLKPGFHAGVFAKIPFSDFVGIQPELMYSGKGVRVNYDEDAFADGESKFNLHYVEMPVLLVINPSDVFFIEFGPYVSVLVGANTETDANFFGADVYSDNELDRNHFMPVDYGATGGIGFDLETMIVGARYSLGMQQVAKDDDVSYDLLGDARNAVWQVYVGFKF